MRFNRFLPFCPIQFLFVECPCHALPLRKQSEKRQKATERHLVSGIAFIESDGPFVCQAQWYFRVSTTLRGMPRTDKYSDDSFKPLQKCNVTEALLLFRSVAKNEEQIKMLYKVDVSSLMQCLATHLMEEVHFVNVMMSFHELLSTRNEDANDPHDPVLLEEGMLLVTQSLWTWEELLEIAPETRLCALRQRLNDLGQELVRRM